MARNRKEQVLAIDAHPVVGDADKLDAASGKIDIDLRCTRIETVLEQLLERTWRRHRRQLGTARQGARRHPPGCQPCSVLRQSIAAAARRYCLRTSSRPSRASSRCG